MQEETVQKQTDTQKAHASVFAKEKTYGERMYHRIFDVGTNFWVNLILSGIFTFWVKHYEKPIWGEGTMLGKLGIGNNWYSSHIKKNVQNLGDMHAAGIKWLANGRFLKSEIFGLKTETLREKRAESIVNVFTLQTPGHFIMIPSVVLGGKYKSKIVEYFDRKHYGDAAMNSDEMKERHHRVAMEERPTFMGAVMGRIGGMAINMGLGSLIGSPDNLLNKLGLKNFKGIDPTAGKVGEHVASALHDVSPKSMGKANEWLAKNGFNETGKVNELSRFLAQDVMYTISTSSTIHPVVNFMRRILPGMTVKPVESPAKIIAAEAPTLRTTHAAKEAAKETTIEKEEAQHHPRHHDKPSHHVTHAHKESTVAPRHEHHHAHAGA